MITESDILELSGEESLVAVTDLNVRGQGIHKFDVWCSKLPNLTLLSLSHNNLSNLQGFTLLRNLQHLNLNSNALTNIDELQFCTQLLELHACNNCIRSIQSLVSCCSLTALSLYSNSISDLQVTTSTLAQLTNLRNLDLAGNPCSSEPTYPQDILAVCNLSEFDGECSTQSLQPEISTQSSTSSTTTSPTDTLSGQSSLLGQPGRALAKSPTYHPNTAPSKSSSCKLFSTQFLNTNPVLLQYLAKSYTAALPASEDQRSRRRSFVHKLRSTAANMSICETLQPEDLAHDPCLLQLDATSTQFDLDDPYELMKHLLTLCEKLQEENECLKAHTAMPATSARPASGTSRPSASSGLPIATVRTGSGTGTITVVSSTPVTATQAGSLAGAAAGGVGDGAADGVGALERELKLLQQENRNIEWLRMENKALRADVAELHHQLASQSV